MKCSYIHLLYTAMSCLCLLLFISLVHAEDNSIAVQILPDREECFHEDVDGIGVKVFIHYMVTAGGGLDIEVTIKGPDDQVIWNAQRDSENRILFKTREAGRHTFCFSNRMSTIRTKVVAFSVMIGNDDEYGIFASGKRIGAASKEEAMRNDPLLRSIRRIQQGLQEIESMQTYLRTRERHHRGTTETANTRVIIWSLIEIIVIVAMGVTSVFYLRKMFKSKRVV